MDGEHTAYSFGVFDDFCDGGVFALLDCVLECGVLGFSIEEGACERGADCVLEYGCSAAWHEEPPCAVGEGGHA